MSPFGNEDKNSLADQSTDSNDSNELRSIKKEIKNKKETTEETKCSKEDVDSIVVDFCSENRTCSSKKTNKTNSTTSLHSCSCGPECGPEKCEGRKRSALVGWDDTRSKMFLCLVLAFVVWLAVYVPISLTLF